MRSRLPELHTSQQVGLPASAVAVTGGARGKNVVLNGRNRQRDVVGQRAAPSVRCHGQLGGGARSEATLAGR